MRKSKDLQLGFWEGDWWDVCNGNNPSGAWHTLTHEEKMARASRWTILSLKCFYCWEKGRVAGQATSIGLWDCRVSLSLWLLGIFMPRHYTGLACGKSSNHGKLVTGKEWHSCPGRRGQPVVASSGGLCDRDVSSTCTVSSKWGSGRRGWNNCAEAKRRRGRCKHCDGTDLPTASQKYGSQHLIPGSSSREFCTGNMVFHLSLRLVVWIRVCLRSCYLYHMS